MELRIATEMPVNVTAGSVIEKVAFEVVNSEGAVDETFHDGDGQSHTLQLKSDIFNIEDCIRYSFYNGRCTVPSIPVPEIEGNFCLKAAHSRHPELQIEFNICVVQAPKLNYDAVQSPSSNANMLLLPDSTSLEPLGNSQSLDNAVNSVLPIMKFQKGLCKYAEKIKKCESDLEYLKEVKGGVEQKLYHLQDSCSILSNVFTREEIEEDIMKRSNSAAAILCHLSRDLSSQESHKLFTQQILGVVALLGTVRDNRLSRILAEYLGEDQMCALVCTSFKAATALEKYKENGEVAYELAGKCISGRFNVICLENTTIYGGAIESNNDGRKNLVLPDPKMPNGNTANGFIGYAVNMVEVTSSHCNTMTSSGHGLQETLFYRLFGELQVYETRDHMHKARFYINHDAVSLDGGILRKNGIISFGCGNPEICFPANEMHISSQHIENKKLLDSMNKNLQAVNNTILKFTERHERSLEKFKKKKNQFSNSLDQIQVDTVMADQEFPDENPQIELKRQLFH